MFDQPVEIAEMSVVTVLVVDAADSTSHVLGLSPDEAGELLDQVHLFLEKTVARFMGTLVRFSGDGGLAIFGWPSANDDHAGAAVQCALAIRSNTGAAASADAVALLQSLKFRIGIHSGLVGLRELASPGGVHLDTSGSVVHLAASLEKAALPGEILISSDAIGLMSEPPRIEEADSPWKQYGLETPIYRVVGPPTGRPGPAWLTGANAPFEGRRGLLERMQAWLENERGSIPALALIGEPGIGKTRLAAELARRFHSAFPVFAAVRANPLTRMAPYSLARELLRALATSAAPEGTIAAGGVPDDLVSAYQPAEVMPLLQNEGGEVARSASSGRVIRVFCDLLSKLAGGRSSLIIVDDIHLADRESLDCLQALNAAMPESIALIATARNEGREAVERTGFASLDVPPLEPDAMGRLAVALASGRGLAIDRLDKAVGLAGGIPLFLEHYLAQAFGQEGRLPQNLSSLVHARINLLDGRVKELAQTLAVLGNDTPGEIAALVGGFDVDALASAMGELERYGLAGASAGGRLGFHHALVAEACRGMVPRKRKSRILAAALEVYGKAATNQPLPHERLGEYALAADLPAVAVHHFWQAGLAARRQSALGSLKRIFDAGMAATRAANGGGPVDEIDFVLMVFSALIQKGEFAEMASHLAATIRRTREGEDTLKQAAALSHLAMINWFNGAYSDGLKSAQKALELSEGQSQTPIEFAARLMLAANRHGLAMLPDSIAEFEAILAMLETEAPRGFLGAPAIPEVICRSLLAWALLDTGDFVKAAEHSDIALELARTRDDPYGEVLALSSKGSAQLLMCRLPDALASLRLALDLSCSRQYDAIRANLAGRLAIALALAGQPGEGECLLAHTRSAVSDTRTGQTERFYMRLGMGVCSTLANGLAAGSDALDEAVAIARDAGNACLLLRGLAIRHELAEGANAATSGSKPRDERLQITELIDRHGLAPWPSLASMAGIPAMVSR